MREGGRGEREGEREGGAHIRTRFTSLLVLCPQRRAHQGSCSSCPSQALEASSQQTVAQINCTIIVIYQIEELED